MGFFDEQIEQANVAKAALAPWDDFRRIYGDGYGPANPVSAEYAHIVEDFVHRIPPHAGTAAYWTLDPDGAPYFHFLPSAPRKPSVWERNIREHLVWDQYQERVRVIQGNQRARILTIWLAGLGSGDYDAAIFARRAESPWIAVQGKPSTSSTGNTLWSESGNTWKVTGPLTDWLLNNG
jgi:hypothetical protein